MRRADKDNPEDKEGTIYTVQDEAEAVKNIFQLYSTGQWSLSKLADWINEQGFRTRNNRKSKGHSGNEVTKPTPFSLYSIRWLLHNPFFTGKVGYHGQLYEGQHQAIIDDFLFNQVQEQLKKAKKNGRSTSPSFRNYLLKGLIRCIYCGYPLWCETTSNGYSLYRERKSSRSTDMCLIGEKAIRCNVIDEQMNAVIEAIALEPSWREKVIAKLALISEHDQVLKERKQTTERLKRLSKVYVDGLIEEREYNLQRKLLQDRLDTLVVPEMDATIKAGELIENLGNIWREATLDEKHILLTIMLDAVYIDLLNNRSIVGILPKPAFYHLFESLKQKPGSKVMIFNPKENAPDVPERVVVMVETGESWSIPETTLALGLILKI